MRRLVNAAIEIGALGITDALHDVCHRVATFDDLRVLPAAVQRTRRECPVSLVECATLSTTPRDASPVALSEIPVLGVTAHLGPSDQAPCVLTALGCRIRCIAFSTGSWTRETHDMRWLRARGMTNVMGKS